MNNPPNNPQPPTGWPHGYHPIPPQPVAATDQNLAQQLYMIGSIDQTKRQQHAPQYSNQLLPNGVQLAHRVGQIPSPTSPHFPQGHQGAPHITYQQMPPNMQQNLRRWVIPNGIQVVHDPRIGNQIINTSTSPANTSGAATTSTIPTQSTPNGTTHHQSSSSSGIQSPVQTQHQPNTPEQVLIFQRNNKRLNQLALEMETEAMFGPACDEFKGWLQDVRAYHMSNEGAIMKCSAIVRKNMSYGPWSSMCIFQTLYKFRHYLSEGSQRAITNWYNEVCASVTGSSRSTSAQSSPITSTVSTLPPPQQSPQQQPSYFLPGVPTATTQLQIAGTQLPLSTQQPFIAQPAVTIPNVVIPVAFPASNITPNIVTSSLSQGNLQRPSPYQYLYRIEYAIAPFRLQHKKVDTILPFFIGRSNFNRIWRQLVQPEGGTMPISYVLIAWRNGAPDTKCEWPDTINIEVNGKQPKLTRRVKVRVPGRTDNTYHYTGKDKPADLEMYLKEGKNELMIRQLDCACCYWFSIQVFVRETESVVVNRIMAHILDINVGRNIISKLLGKSDAKEDDDLEVLHPVVRISLKCPISLMRIKTPIKGRKCKHPECFDLHSYLAISVDNPKWRCPICNTYIPPDTICRDALNEKLLREVDKNVCEVEYTEDCDHYRISKTEDTEEEAPQGQAKTQAPSGTREYKVTGDKEPIPVKTEAQAENVISLISDDEDEEEQRHEVQGYDATRKRTVDDHQEEETITATGAAADKRTKLDNDMDRKRTTSYFAPDDMYDFISTFASEAFTDTNHSSSSTR